MRLTIPRVLTAALLAATLALAGCAYQPRLEAVPRDVAREAIFLGIPDARFALNGDPAPLAAMFVAAERRRLMAGGGTVEHMLAISGGGENGAFGAGLLYGLAQLHNFFP